MQPTEAGQAMAAGREMDALVAEKVMGWTRNGSSWRTPDGKTRSIEMTSYGSFRPSEDMNAAWEVVERLHRDFEYVRILITEDGATVKIPLADRRFAKVMADTTPHAICLAALDAKGITIPA